jgi:hypothetical protein
VDGIMVGEVTVDSAAVASEFSDLDLFFSHAGETRPSLWQRATSLLRTRGPR